MSGHGDGGGGGSANWRARFFWVTEWVYALIGGAFEAYVYHAYTPAGADPIVTWGESVLRACITQIMVVLLAVAAVEMWRSGAHVLAKVMGFASIQLFAVLFAFVAFWLMRVAALAFQQTDILGSAIGSTLPVPLLGDVSAQELTLDIVAGLPFFQLVINLFAPIITKERRQLSAEEIRAKSAADLAQIEANAAKRVAQARGIGATLAAVKAAAIPGDTPALPSGVSITLADTNPAGIGIPASDSGPLPANVSRLLPRAKGPWYKEDIAALVSSKHGVKMTSDAALNAVREAGKGKMNGTAYTCTIVQGKSWVKRHYGEPKGEGEREQREVIG